MADENPNVIEMTIERGSDTPTIEMEVQRSGSSVIEMDATAAGQAAAAESAAQAAQSAAEAQQAQEEAEAAAEAAEAAAETAAAAYGTDLLAPDFNQATANNPGTYVIYSGGIYLLPDGHTAGATWANTTKVQVTVGSELCSTKSAFTLQEENVPGTTQTISFDSVGNVSQIVHSANGVAVRTDVFTFGADTITEVRTLSTGESLTIVTNTDTLVTTTTYADAA